MNKGAITHVNLGEAVGHFIPTKAVTISFLAHSAEW